MLDKRAQGRPARGAATVGPKKIIEGMQDALRSLQTSSVTRKDIARFAGVTPALVTYYFPERNTLIEAATYPIVEDLALAIRERLSLGGDPQHMIQKIIGDVVACYVRDISIVELYIAHRKSAEGEASHDALQDVAGAISSFFDDWLLRCSHCHYSGEFLTNALFGLCRAMALHHQNGVLAEIEGDRPGAYVRMIYTMLIGGMQGFPLDDLGRSGDGRAASGAEPSRPTPCPRPVGGTISALAREEARLPPAAAPAPMQTDRL